MDINQIEEAILTKTFLAKALRYQDFTGSGWLDLPKFNRALLPYAAGGMLPIRPFASEFVAGVRREAGQAPQPIYQERIEVKQSEAHFVQHEMLESIKDFLYDQGPRGITSLAAAIRDADPQNARVIGFDTFEMVLQDFFQDTPCQETDIATLFDMFRQPQSPQLPYDEFFLALKEEPSAPRRAAIRQAFRRLDVASEGVVDISTILRSFNANRHPQVSVGARSASEVLEERGQRSYPTNLVAWEEFEDYYKSINGCFESDEEFCGVLEKVWDLNKAPDASVEGRAALARPAAGAPGNKLRAGLHHWQTNTLPATTTHHKVEAVTKAEDVLQRTRQQITRKGLRAAIDVVQQFYAADDDVDDQLDMYEFRQACRKAGLSFREAEEVSIFESCAETKGKIHLPSFLKLLHGERQRDCGKQGKRAFAAVGGNPQDDQSVVSPGKLKEHFKAEAHPLVVRGQLESGYVLAEFLDTFSQLAHVLGGCENGMVSFNDFLAYYDVVSSTVENDSLFDLIVQRVWDVKTRASDEASPRRLIRTVDDAPSPTAEKRPPPHSGPSTYTMDRAPQKIRERSTGIGHHQILNRPAGIVFADIVNTLQDVFQRLRCSISLRGLRGWLAVVQRFQHFDYRRNGTIMRLDWQRLNRSLGLGLSSEDQELLFKELSKKKRGQAMVKVSSPEVTSDEKDPRQAESEFFEAIDFFSLGAPFDAEKFDEFFRMVSAVHEDDDELDHQDDFVQKLHLIPKKLGNLLRLEDESLSLGCKRNLGIFLASGDVIVHFDDDDVYGPSYIAEMVSELQRRHLVALTLSAWFDFDLRLQRCGFVDPEDFRGGRGGRSVWRVACGDAETGSDAKI
eukprot:g24336.t1